MSDKPYQRYHNAVCKDSSLAFFMFCLSRFLAGTDDPALFTDDDGVERQGIARTWEQWAEDLGLTLKQFRRVLEKAVRLGYIVRARRSYTVRTQRSWNRFSVIRLHVAITDTYLNELTQSVSLGTKAYLACAKVIQPEGNEGQDQDAGISNTVLPTKGSTILPTEGNYKEDSLQTLSKTLQKTAVAANAGDAQPLSLSSFLPGKKMTPSPPSPVQTVTSEGLARKFKRLGLLAEWKRVGRNIGAPSSESATDEQLAALEWWCTTKNAGATLFECVNALIDEWNAHVNDSYATADTKQPEVGAPKQPDLDFIQWLMKVAEEPAEPTYQKEKPITHEEILALEAEQAAVKAKKMAS